MNYELEILIPTFNRALDLKKNLEILKRQIEMDNLQNKIQISISDNHSEDQSKQIVQQFQSTSPEINLNYHKQANNIGLEPNAVFLLQHAQCPYILWLGDDDYLADGYLQFVINAISENNIGVIITGLAALKADGTLITQRDKTKPIIDTKCGFNDMLAYSHLAHQMSGLVLRRDGLFEKYLEHEEWRNPYLFIFLTSYCLLKYNGKYAPKFETQITDFNAKDWGYNKVGLLDEVFKSYYYFIEEVGEQNAMQLLLKFSVVHSYRYNIDPLSPMRLVKQYKSIIKTTLPFKGFKSKLRTQLVKDYILSFLK